MTERMIAEAKAEAALADMKAETAAYKARIQKMEGILAFAQETPPAVR